MSHTFFIHSSVVSGSFRAHGMQPPRLLCPWDSPGNNAGVGCHFLLEGDLPDPGIEPRSPVLQADSLLSEPPGKAKKAGVGSLSLLQGIFPTQELNQDLLHCRWILYQLSYQGSPWVTLDSALLSVSPSDSNDYLL